MIKSGRTLHRHDIAITISGTAISLGASEILVIDPNNSATRTIPFPSGLAQKAVTVGDKVLIVDGSGGLVLSSGKTLRVGDQPVMVSGTLISMGPSGVAVVNSRGSTVTSISNGGNGNGASRTGVSPALATGGADDDRLESILVVWVVTLVTVFLELV